ncbi:ABC transporter substrate-binding protein, partial [Candidatus Bipolaricaulota bacterium]|nr:ABC transporter substrate-binding protein [Candidatus Bipolaricaulota bacterium]
LVTFLLGLTLVNFGYGEATRTVTDGLDRQVSLSGNPERVVTTDVPTTEIALDLGLDERLVGVPDLIKHLSYVPELQEKAKKKKKVGKFKMSLEKVAGSSPDLIIIGASSQKGAIKKLEELGATVYAAGSKSISDVKEAILDIGYLTGTKSRAQEIVGKMVYKEVRLKEAVRRLDAKKKVFYTFTDSMYTTGGNTFLGEALELAGLNNVFSGLSGYKKVATEEIIRKNPELILATKDMGLTKEGFKTRVGLKGVQAVEEGNIIFLSQGEDSMINQAGTKIVVGAINLFEKVYDKGLSL